MCLALCCKRVMKETERNVSFPQTCRNRSYRRLKVWNNRKALSLFVYVCVRETEFPICVTLAWSGGWIDKLPLLTLNLCLGPPLHKRARWVRPFCSLQLFDISTGFNPKWLDGEEVEGGSSFSRQTRFWQRAGIVFLKCSMTNTVGATNRSDFSQKKEDCREEWRGPWSKRWRISLHFWTHAWSACKAIFPQVIHSLPHTTLMPCILQ